MSTRVLVLISGNGSNLQALIDRIVVNKELSNTEIVGVISNRKTAYGLERASKNNIPTSVHTLKSYKDKGLDRIQYDADLADLVLSYKPDVIVLAGFMHILSPQFLNKIDKQITIINLHPALPGQFDGAKAIERAFEAFKEGKIQHTGVMVHKVIAEVDQGEPILTEKVEILKSDELKDLEERIHSVEHKIIFEALKKVIEERS